ncbi:hypothetical protein ONS95_010441 [Cadophora gregata]|uniref:uncharacterized protein n=1 Tax=Cadophora gregata TaxID=51156 RepID=UPI0026DB7D7B|nr:uncharacterized protein ONS95_010441 [Cadophora gregata]KAK0122183.1 hypothetical protein ONS95_010441 [Cadophora gregata]
MAPDEALKSAKSSQDELAVISNRLAIAMAKREALVKSWTASSSRTEPEKTQEELDAEDAALFQSAPPYLGVGAAIPAHFLANESERGKKALRAKLLTTKGLKASKARDVEEKAASAKRAMREESSDEEEGRSSLGRAKKLKGRPKPASVLVAKQEAGSDSDEDERKHLMNAKKRKLEVEEEEPKTKVTNAGTQNKKISRVQKGQSPQSGDTEKDQMQDVDSSEVDDTGIDEPKRSLTEKMNQTKPKDPKSLAEDSSQKEVAAGSKKEDGMDAKERRKLKKKEKKRLKKLREAKLATKA